MIKKWLALWAAAIAVLAGLLFWKNSSLYPSKSRRWCAGKSFADLALILVAAAYLPALLITWCVMWITKPIKSPGLRATAGILVGAVLGLLSTAATGVMELVVLVSAFAIDIVTGHGGFLGHLDRYRQQELKKAA
jgi:hypothetical protein